MKRLVVVAMLLVSGSCLAQSVGTGNGAVTNFTPTETGGVEFFVLTLTTMNTASCATSGRFALSASAPHYRTTVELLLHLYFGGGSVFARGRGTCDTYPGAEDLAYVCADGGAPC